MPSPGNASIYPFLVADGILRWFASKEYYLSDKVVAMFQRINRKHEEKGNGFRFEPKDGKGVSNTITTREGERTEDTYLEVPIESNDLENVSTPLGTNSSFATKSRSIYLGANFLGNE